MSGFLATGEKLKDVLKADNTFVNSQGFTHQQLAEPLFYIMSIIDKLNIVDGQNVEFLYKGKRYKAELVSWKGFQQSIFNDGLGSSQDFTVINLETGATLSFFGLVPHYIWRYGFYGGHTGYRLEPKAIIDVFFTRGNKGSSENTIQNTSQVQSQRKFELLILDLDDTLLDSTRIGLTERKTNVFFKLYANKLGVSFEEGKKEFLRKKNEFGLPSVWATARKLGMDLEAVVKDWATIDIGQYIKQEDKRLIEELKGLKDKGYKVALLSNNTRGFTDNIVSALGIQSLLDGVYTTYEIGREKPDSGLFELVAKEMGVTSSQVISVGDSKEKDIEPARKIGMETIHIPTQEQIYNLNTAVVALEERIHTTNLQDTLTYIQTQPQTQPLIVALGTGWIKGYEKGRYLQYDALNPLIGSLRTYCESKDIPFIVDDDDKLLARITAERAKEGKTGAKVVVLAGKDTVASDEFTTLRNDQKNAFVVGVDNQELTTDSYIRLMEMLTLALKLSVGLEVSLDNAHITITKDNRLHIYIFLPHAEPMDYERLKVIYEVQKFA